VGEALGAGVMVSMDVEVLVIAIAVNLDGRVFEGSLEGAITIDTVGVGVFTKARMELIIGCRSSLNSHPPTRSRMEANPILISHQRPD
jgi:hypothetical protein